MSVIPTVSADGVGVVSAGQLNAYTLSCYNSGVLRTVVGQTGMSVFLQGTNTPSDGGQGSFYWDYTSTATDDNFAVIRPYGVIYGAWLRTKPFTAIGGDVSLAVATATDATTSRTLASYFGDVFNVKNYGAIGDGTTDDTTAIQAAINAAQTAGAGQVWFPAGTYKITGTLSITKNKISLLGAGVGATTLNFANGASDCITVVGVSQANQLYYFTLKGFLFTFTGKTGGRSLVLAYVSQAWIYDIYLENCWTGFEIWVTNNISIYNVVFQGISGGSSAPAYYGSYAPGACYGIFFHAPGDGSGRSDALTTVNLIAQGLYGGADGYIWDGAASTWNVFQTTALNCRYGMRIKNSAGSISNFPQFGEFDNFVTDGMSSIGLLIEGGKTMQFTNCILTNTSGAAGQGGGDTNAARILPDVGGSYTNALQFSNCRFGLCKQTAVYIGGRDVQIVNSIFSSGSTTPSNTYAAVQIAAPAQDVVINGNKVSEWGSANLWEYGIQVDAGTYRVLLVGNNLYSAVTQGILWNNNDLGSYCASNIESNPQRTVPGLYTVANGVTLSASQLLGGALGLTGPTANWAATTDTAVNLVNMLQNPVIFTYQTLLLINETAYQLTLNPGASVNFVGNVSGGTFIIPANTQRTFVINVVNPTQGSQQIAFYG